MRISGNEVQKQLHQMIAFIEQELARKWKRSTLNEEEFNQRLVRQQRANIIDYYDKKEKQVEMQRKIQRSNIHNQGRLKCLKAKDDHLRNVLSDARANLCKISEDEGASKIARENVTLKCRHKDKELVSKLLPDCLEELYKIWGSTTKVGGFNFHLTFTKLPLIYVTIDEEYLDKDCAGGVEMTAKVGKIKVCSTLESRLDLIAGQVIPQLRTTLFGPNPSRKFFD
uniref:Uncharacterized protein n=1 Tax=Ditylenchus dipsaci TaxID=166011 RepID=A0A915DT81_9BILA